MIFSNVEDLFVYRNEKKITQVWVKEKEFLPVRFPVLILCLKTFWNVKSLFVGWNENKAEV